VVSRLGSRYMPRLGGLAGESVRFSSLFWGSCVTAGIIGESLT
jgi:hypothetical protein